MSSLTLLVIEDETMLLEAIKKKLSFLNIKVIPATSVAEAKQIIDSVTTAPDAVWLDFSLKDGSGIDVVEYIKQSPIMMHTPVFVVSNSASDEKVTKMLALGAKRYMIKAEYRIEDIIQTIKDFVKIEKKGTS